MAESPSLRPGIAVLAACAGVVLLAPVLVNDRPLAVRDAAGSLHFPALSGAEAMSAEGDRPILWPPFRRSWRDVHLEEALRPPSAEHPLGTDRLGRDLLARMLHGARVSFAVGFGATLLALLGGILLGGAAGLRGGALDLVLSRLIETLACFPALVLALALVAVGGGGIAGMILAVGVARTAATARFARSEAIRWRGTGIWLSARAAGSSGPAAAWRHLLPLAAGPLAVQASFGVAHAVLLESGLSFLGLGAPTPVPSWGVILAEGRATIDVAWWPVVFPCVGLAVVLGALTWAGERASSP